MLAKEIRKISGEAPAFHLREDAKLRRAENAEILAEERARAAKIIAELPGELRHHAKFCRTSSQYTGEGPRAYTVMLLEPDRHGDGERVRNLKGAAAIIYKWCRKNGFEVLFEHDYDPGTEWSGWRMLITW